ncbi:MAG: ArsR family transcriptional regulator [Actinomycetia bacterium]|nr:ArsR family transcriptional regulator [Actinomycetes bacterium]
MLERVEVVARARDLETDGRTSWWRLVDTSLSWSVDDFADSPSDRTQARVAERLNIDHQLGRLAAWKKSADGLGERWRRAAFSSDVLAMATPEELDALNDALIRTWREWRDGIDTDDGHDRRPVFVFAHGFPVDP